MAVPTSSRRTFLKTTLAGATAALGDLNGLAKAAETAPPAGSAGAAAGGSQSGGPAPANTGEYTRGIGVYPGDPREDFAPTLVADQSNSYRNLALLRPAYHSSSYDFNLTAQLVTDGIKDTRPPMWVETSASFTGIFSKEERESFLDHNPTSTVSLMGPRPWVQVRLGGGGRAPKVDRIDLLVVLTARNVKPSDVGFEVSVSDDGWSWKKAGSIRGPKPASRAGFPPEFARHGYLFRPSIPLSGLYR